MTSNELFRHFSELGIAAGNEILFPVGVHNTIVKASIANNLAIIGLEIFEFNMEGRYQTVDIIDYSKLIRKMPWHDLVLKCADEILEYMKNLQPYLYCSYTILDERD